MLSPSAQKELKVLLLDPVSEEAIECFRANHYAVETCFDRLSEAELTRRLADCHLLCVSRREGEEEQYLTEEVLRSAHRLLAIGCFSRETNIIDMETARQMGIPVFSAPFQHQHSVAELIISFIILLARQLCDRSREIHSGNWQKVSDGCHEIRGKTLGILGYGHVGSQLGILAEGIGMRVIFFDIQAIMPIGRNQPVETLDELLEQSDFLAVCISGSKDNVGVIGEHHLGKMKQGSYLINTSYGKAVDQGALVEALKSGHLAGAALDVFPSQPSSKNSTFDNAFKGLKNVILTPSIGEHTAETLTRIGIEVASSMIRFLSDGSTVGAVNFPSVAAWPLKPNSRRIVNMHRNIRGVLREIDCILSAYNVGKQVFDTKDEIGYLIADVNTTELTTEIVSQLALLANTIRTRIL